VPIAKVPHQQGITELSEVCGGQSQAPRRIETVPRNQAMTVAAVQVEYIDEAMVRASLVVVLLFVLFCKSHIELAIDNANTKGRIPRRHVRVAVFTRLKAESYISMVLLWKLVA